jgi:hypothetical protein
MASPKGYTTKEIVEGILQRTLPASANQVIDLLISTAEDMVDGYCNQNIYPASAGEVVLVDGNGTDKLFLPRKINTISAITVSADFTADSSVTADVDIDYIKSKRYHVVYLYGYKFDEGVQNISVTGDFGWTACPSEVVVATSLLVGKLFLPGLQDNLGKSSEEVKDFKATYTKTLIKGDKYLEELLCNYWRPSFGKDK